MTVVANRRPLSRRRKALFALFVSSFSLVASLVIAEIVVRQKGFVPWIIPQPFLSMEPPGDYLVPDATVGYLLKPGTITIALPGPFSFKMNHLSSGLRITHPANFKPEEPSKEIWIFGCSLTHGWSLNDEETYPWLLQEKFRNYEVVNFGVEAYSTIQSFLQFQQALEKRQKPVVAVLAYGSIHDSRNTLNRSWMKMRVPASPRYVPGSISLPYMKWRPHGQPELLHKPLEYHGVPFLKYSALANLIDDTYNHSLEKTYHSHEISKTLIEDFARLCKSNGVEFVVAGMLSDPATTEMLEYLNGKGIMTVDVAVDLNLPENTNLPYDDHPSALANQQYARRLRGFLCGKSLAGPCGG
jgi:hypothetical protein